MSKWTEEELLALRRAGNSYHAFGNLTNYSKSYDAWEVKRRRVDLNDPAEDAAARELVADLMSKPGHVFKPSETAEIGRSYRIPDFVGFNMAFLDIEATDLKGNFGRLLCFSVADSFGKVVSFRSDDPEYQSAKRRDDSKLAVAIRDYLETFDVWVGWNSKMYDIPFINTRLLIHEQRPLRADIMHIDPMYKAGRGSLTLHSRRLDAVAKTFRLDAQKTALDPDIWQDAAEGERKAMDYVVEHCEADVMVLRGAFHVLKPLIRIVHR